MIRLGVTILHHWFIREFRIEIGRFIYHRATFYAANFERTSYEFESTHRTLRWRAA